MTAVSVSPSQVTINNVQNTSANRATTEIAPNSQSEFASSSHFRSYSISNGTPNHENSSANDSGCEITTANQSKGRPNSPLTSNSSSSDTDVTTNTASTSSSSTTALRRMYFKSAKLGRAITQNTTAATITTLLQHQSQQHQNHSQTPHSQQPEHSQGYVSKVNRVFILFQ